MAKAPKRNPSQFGGISITPQDTENALLIEAYGDGGFKLQGRRVKGALFVNQTGFWPVDAGSLDQLSIQQIKEQIDQLKPELILVGTGSSMALVPRTLRQEFEASGIGFDIMDTGAAARTYNVLLLEGRRVAALLLPSD